MRGLDSLIRLQEWKLDEKRRKVTDLERLAQRLHDQLAGLEHEMLAEQKIAASDSMIVASYGHYASAVIQRRAKIVQSLADIESEMIQALEEVAGAFREFKKFDLIRTRNQERDKRREKHIQQGELDEAGLDVFRRRTSA